MKKTFLLGLLLLSSTILVNAQSSRTETVSEWDKKLKKEVTHKEEVQKMNAAGDPVEIWGYDKKGAENRHLKVEYNKAGKKTKEIHFNQKGQVKKIVEFRYDANNRKTEELTYAPDGKTLIEKHKFTYE